MASRPGKINDGTQGTEPAAATLLDGQNGPGPLRSPGGRKVLSVCTFTSADSTQRTTIHRGERGHGSEWLRPSATECSVRVKGNHILL
ncbi:hypothetical protein ZHAS_00013388 [Anopheles sinensis]|uniref:Uncharacterized protein n=1 Tax=Anopheles sinensis TaxID=74873 RepID=A0A084W5F8_ANOSI|nr:hypothetical protein ZHAS_00013388 [Anopheles sinensis]